MAHEILSFPYGIFMQLTCYINVLTMWMDQQESRAWACCGTLSVGRLAGSCKSQVCGSRQMCHSMTRCCERVRLIEKWPKSYTLKPRLMPACTCIMPLARLACRPLDPPMASLATQHNLPSPHCGPQITTTTRTNHNLAGSNAHSSEFFHHHSPATRQIGCPLLLAHVNRLHQVAITQV